MILQKYLTEVSFIDGSSEFKTYRSYEKSFLVEETTKSIPIKLEHKEIVDTTLEVSLKGRYDVPVYFKFISEKETDNIEVYVGEGNLILEGDTIEVRYTALNEAISDLYSVDYEDGVLYLATPPNVDLSTEYESYNILVKAKRADQLESDNYKLSDTDASILNYKPNTSYDFVYGLTKEVSDVYTTPLVDNIKVNYINTSEEESL